MLLCSVSAVKRMTIDIVSRIVLLVPAATPLQAAIRPATVTCAAPHGREMITKIQSTPIISQHMPDIRHIDEIDFCFNLQLFTKNSI